MKKTTGTIKKNIMRKFQFIRFGGKVQWVNDSTDTCRIMQVCTPTPEVITEDTTISLILADEDECAEEEQSVSYAVRAGELTPFLTSYHDGFWQVMLAALESGSNASVVRTILKSFSLSYEECMLLIQRFDQYKSEFGAIINSHFKVNENASQDSKSAWMRLGATITGSKQDIEKVLQGDETMLRKLLKEERFQIEGNTYIPEVSVTEYNTDNGTCFEETEVEFELQ